MSENLAERLGYYNMRADLLVELVAEDPVTAWRRGAFLAAGCRSDLAQDLADGQVDTHDFARLVARGCPPDLAARIL